MKKILFIIAVLLLSQVTVILAAEECEELYGCERKICELRTELQLAEKYDHPFKAVKLKEALQKIESHCSDEYFRSDYFNEVEETKSRIVDYEEEIIDAVEDIKDSVKQAVDELHQNKSANREIASDIIHELGDCREDLSDAGKVLQKEIDTLQVLFIQESTFLNTQQPLVVEGIIRDLYGAKRFVKNKQLELQKYIIALQRAGLNDALLRQESNALNCRFADQIVLIERLEHQLAGK